MGGFINQAVAVGQKTIEQGIARDELSKKELAESARSKIEKARNWTQSAMEEGLIEEPPEED